ncbi:MAG: DUF5689 domain-containing protein [Bacteroidota bacterium]
MRLKSLFFLSFLAVLGLTFNSCVDQDFDEPPVRGLPALEANATIAQLKALHTLGTNATEITEDWIVAGTVVADDQSGNLYQQLVIEDESAGIVIRLGNTGLYTLYPVGTQLFIQMKGLYVNDFNNLYQIAGDSDGGLIPSPLISEYVTAGEPKEVTPTATTLDEILSSQATFNNLLSRLITLEDMQFADVDLGDTYAVPGGGGGQNRTMTDCFGNSVTVRNSDFADFAGDPIPDGNGSVTAVLSVFGSTVQLTLRDASDVQFGGDRCGVSTGGDLVSIADIRSAFASGATAGPDDSKIRGVVISDVDNGNTTGRNMVIQDGTAGIVVRFTSNHSFPLGEEVEVTVSGQELSEFNGLVQVNEVPLGNAVSQGAATLPTPRVATVAELLANGDAWESTLVQIAGATMNGGPTYGDGVDVSDGTGTIPMFTFFSASFGGDQIPSDEGTLTAILSRFNGLQLNMRNAADADFEGGGGGDPQDVSAAELRSLFEGGASSAPAAQKLRGVVISDGGNGNTTGRNLVLQDDSGGIIIRFADDHSFALGEDIEIVVSGQELSEFNGLLQVNNVPNANAVSFGPGMLPEPREATIQDILDNSEAWESTLVTIEDVSFTEGGTYNGLKTLQDATGSIGMFTRSDASFSTSAVPAGEFTIIAIVSQFNDPQVLIRNLNDIIE